MTHPLGVPLLLLPLLGDAPDVNIPEPEDVEAENPKVEDEAADVETEADL